LGRIYDWESKWTTTKTYTQDLHEDLRIREFIHKQLEYAGISKIIIERFGQKIKINIHTAKPGVVIGRSGAEVERLREAIKEMTSREVVIDIFEIKQPELDAQLVAENIALQIEKRVSYRRAMRQAVEAAMRFGAEGIKVSCAGRLGGAELARRVWYREGRVPLHMIRGDIDYGFAEAKTTYGQIGVKVWIFKGEVPQPSKQRPKEEMIEDADAKEGEVSQVPEGKKEGEKS
jgi:small subunit ribosomal protein S3